MMDSLDDILRTKVELLCNGIVFHPSVYISAEKNKCEIPLARKGGAGPAGGIYLEFSNESIVNTMVFSRERNDLSLEAESIDDKYFLKYDLKNAFLPRLVRLKLIPNPKFYSIENTESIPFKKIALIHGNRVIASTVNQRCIYWRGHQECKFCAIEHSLDSGATLEKKTGKQLIDAINAAKAENPNYVQHLTLTIGTTSTSDKGMATYLEIIKEIKHIHPNIPIHIQIEPMQDISWYKILHEAGADTIGIHLEIFDDQIRKIMCPGKSYISKSVYKDHWRKAIDIFGKNQVNSFILTGFETDLNRFKDDLEDMIKIGVLPEISPVRSIPSLLNPMPKTNALDFYQLSLFSAKSCKKYGLNPLLNKAGCIRCEGCSTLIDAYRVLE